MNAVATSPVAGVQETRESGKSGVPVSITEAGAAAWDRCHRDCSHATWYQSRPWMEHLARFRSPRHHARPIRAGAWHFRFADGLEGIVPYHCFRATRGLARKYISGGDTLYGGWVGDSYPQSEHMDALRGFLRKKNLAIRQSPFAPGGLPADRCEVTAEFSAVLDLAPGIEAIEANWRRNSPKILQYSRKAERAGVVVRKAETREEWMAFAAAHHRLLERRDDATIYGADFFASLRALAAPETQLWIAIHEDRIVAGQLALIHNTHAGIFVKGATPEALALKAPILIDTTMIRACGQAGVRWYDHDGCGSPDASIAEYKRRLGCAFIPSPILEHRRGLLAAAGRVTRALRCIQHSITRKAISR